MSKDHRPLSQIKADIDKTKAEIAVLTTKLEGFKTEASALADDAAEVSERERFD